MLRLIIIAISLAVVAVFARPLEPAVRQESGAFSYDPFSGIGPPDWGSISGFETCGTGTMQSPINVRQSISEMEPMSEGPMPMLINTELQFSESTEQFNLDCETAGTCGFTMYNEERFDLFNFHCHSISEHRLRGRPFIMECHMAHSSESGELLVIGTLFRLVPGSMPGNPVIEEMLDQIEAGDTNVEIDLSELIGEEGYVGYTGSLTTPPCTEGVNWFIALQTQPVSIDQVNRYIAIAGSGPFGNNRPIQPLNGRDLTAYVEEE